MVISSQVYATQPSPKCFVGLTNDIGSADLGYFNVLRLI